MTDQHNSLDFEDDPKSGRSTWVALGLVIAAVAWMASGMFIGSDDEDISDSNTSTPAPASVATRLSTAEPITLFFRGEGQAQPDRDTALRTEVSGDVAEVLVTKGEDVTAGQVLARLTTERLRADLRRAEEEFDRAEREFTNAEILLERGVATADRVSSARATLAAARALRTNAEEALESARVEAPFDGRIERLGLDEGEYVAAGSEVGRIVDNQPLTVSLQIPQQRLADLRDAGTAEVRFITGQTREGQLTFIGSAAAADTRTFLAEITVPNEDRAIPAGISAEVRIPTGQARAHFVAPSIVSLNTEGEIGVKSVVNGEVTFNPVKIVRAEVDGVWVTGLPDEVEIITIGQGYVQAGEPVRTRPESAGPGAATDPDGSGAPGAPAGADAGATGTTPPTAAVDSEDPA